MTSNNVNVELRPGTRLVREVNGNRETMWVEEDIFFPSRSMGWVGFLIMMVFVILVFSFLHPSAEGGPSNNTVRKEITVQN